MKFTKYLLVLFIVLGTQDVMSQLSSRHFMPPLKRANNWQNIGGQAMYLSTPETTAFDVNVYQGTSTIPTATLSISNSSPYRYEPPLGTGGSASSGDNNTSIITGANAGIVLSTAGFRFEAPSGKKFYVNWRAANTAQASSLVSAGEAGLGTDFRWGGTRFPYYPTYSSINSVIGIMATEDNTQVSIYGYNPACTFTKNSINSGVGSITDDVITLTLNAGQSFVLEAQPTGTTAATSPNTEGWLGTTISSDKKIAVNQGHMGLSLSNGNQDMSMTQITPTSNIGKEYVFIRGLGGDLAEFPVIIATENNTEIYVNNEVTPIATLNNGEWIQIPSSKYSLSGTGPGNQGANMYVKASKDIYAIQTIAVENGSAPATLDVFQVAPLNCLLDNGVNKVPDIINSGLNGSNLASVYLMLMASSAISESNIIIKYGTGSVSTVPASTLTAVKKSVSGTSEWVTYFVPSISGDVSVYAPGPVAVAYLGINGAVGVAAYFSGFGTIPTIDVQSTGNGCFPNTTLTATPGFTSYAWYKDGELMPSITSNTLTPTVAGDYYVVVYNGFCTYPSATKTVFDCNPEVVVKNTASKKFLLPGETTTFTISVKLLGGSAAQNLQISNVLPAHLTYTSSTVTKGTFSGSGSNYTWNVGTMSNGEENILTILATAQSVTSAFSETYITNNTQTFALGNEANNLADDKTENVIIYPGCSSSLAGTILGGTSYCTTTNSTTLTASNAVGDLQWQSSTDNTNFSDISGATAPTLIVANLTSTTYYRIQATVDNCIVFSIAEPITVSQGPAYSMTSATGSDAQTLCINTAITSITYSTTNTTGVSFSGLPSGVSGTWVNNVATISGTPTAAGTFNYTVTITGSCAITTAGSLTISNTNNTISLTSAAGTNAQSIDNNVAITTIIYNTTGATGASISGLPLGVTGTWTNNSVSIAGTPSTAGVYNYTILLTGGCGSVTSIGTITVKGVTITSNLSGSSICSGTNVTFTANAIGFNSPAYQWFKNTVAISGAINATYTTASLSNNDQISVSCINSPGIVNDNTLSLWLDAGNSSSYSGTGTTWTNIGTGGATYNAAISAAHQTYSSNNGGYFQFDGTANPMLINKVTSAVTEVTMSTWVYITPGTTQGAFIKNGGSLGYTFGAGGGGGFCSSNFPGMLLAGQGWIGSYPPASNFLTGWQLCTMVVSGLNPTTYKYYINGNLANTATFTGALAPSGNYTALGDNYGDGGACTTFNSKMGAAYIYTKALSSSEITQNYNASASRFGLSTIGTAITSNTITTTVTTNNTVTAASSTPVLCVNTVLTDSTHITTGATSIGTATGLPAGVTATFASNTITISGTPTVGGTFNYSIPLTGGCGSVYATGTITVNQISSISSAQVLVVAGGGSGGVGRGGLGGGGGGGGGVVYSNTYPLSSGTYNVTVGGGGSFIPAGGLRNGQNGSDSVFGTLTAVGGGGGGSDGENESIYFGQNGGSGGGSAVWSASAGSSTQTTQTNETNHYGTSGGLSAYQWVYVAGGGGGAGHAGYTPNLNGYGNYGGNGGEGITIPFNSGSPTGYFAAGGGGSGALNNRGIGGSSIGGSGSGLNSITASSGVTNTGSGGGGVMGFQVSGAGGSGIVIIQYLGTPIATGGTITQTNGYTIHTFTSSGTFSNGLGIASSSQILCQNATATALTSTLSGVDYTFQWYRNNLPNNTGGTIINGAISSSYTPSSSNAGTTYYYIVVTNSSGCSTSSGVSGAIIITANNSFNAASSAPVLCINTALTNITHATSGATSIGTATGLPAGVTAAFSSNLITISGTPTVSGTFNYSIPLTGGCGSVNATGTITVNPTLTVNLAVSGDACVNKTTLSTTTGFTSYTWYKDNVAISGATSNIYVPTTAGDYKVRVSNGACSAISSSTTISVCGLTSEGKMISILNSTTLVNKNGAKNSGKGIDERGLVLTKPVYYGTITTRTGRIWLDRNLGATRVALSPTDTQSYGDYYQWGRSADGHEKHIVSGTTNDYTTVRSATTISDNNKYIFPNDGSFDWLTTPDNTLWSGVNAPNNPCPAGFRIPTLEELLLEKSYFTSNDVNGSFENGYGLRLTLAGMGTSANSILAKDNFGQYLTQTAYSTGQVRYFGVTTGNAWNDNNYYKTTGQSCRCIKD